MTHLEALIRSQVADLEQYGYICSEHDMQQLIHHGEQDEVQLDDTSARVVLAIPNSVIPLAEQIKWIKLCARRIEVDEKAKSMEKRVAELQGRGELSISEEMELGRLRMNLQMTHQKWRQAPRDRSGYMANSWPSKYFGDAHLELSTEEPYLIYNVLLAEQGYTSGSEGNTLLSQDAVRRQLKDSGRRGLTLAEGIAVARHFPHLLEGDYHVDLLASNMQVMNTTNGVVFMPRPQGSEGRSAFSYLSTQTRITRI